MLALEPVEPAAVSGRPKLRLGLLGKPGEELCVAPADCVGLAARFKLLQGVLADRLQHREARLAIRTVHLPHQALVHQ